MLWTVFAGGCDGAASPCAAIFAILKHCIYHDFFKIADWKLLKLQPVQRSEVATTGIAPV